MSREEVLWASGPTPGCVIRAKMGVTRDGMIKAVSAELMYEAGCYPGSAVRGGVNCIFGPYENPNGQIDGYDVVVNKPKTEAYRAPGVPQCSFAAETLIDEVCKEIGMDPLEFRLKNVAREGTRKIDGMVLPRVGFEETIRAAMAHPHLKAPLGGPNRGRGIGSGWWANIASPATYYLEVNSDGTVSGATGSQDLSGTRTTAAMQAAEILGIPVERIRPITTDTNSTSFNANAGGSSRTHAVGEAAVEAAHKVIAEMRKRAAIMWQVDPDTVQYARGSFTTAANPALTLTFDQVAAVQMETGGQICADAAIGMRGQNSAIAVHIADVEVDPDTGKVTVLRYTCVQDAGKAVHPSFVEGQMQGGASQGIGYALYEGYKYGADGQMLNDTLQDYRLPTALDLPMIDTVIVEVPNPSHPLGVRGVSEPAIVPPLATIANAVANAIGARLYELPLTPDRILDARKGQK